MQPELVVFLVFLGFALFRSSAIEYLNHVLALLAGSVCPCGILHFLHPSRKSSEDTWGAACHSGLPFRELVSDALYFF